MALKLYNKKRDFKKTSEPEGLPDESNKRRFVVQEHHASSLHFDLRLEMSGVMKSWAVPKGPSMNPNDKHLAVMVEDHPIAYNTFEGTIPEGEYGAGEVRRWDAGTYKAIGEEPIEKQLKAGKLTFILKGKKLKGEFHIVEMKGRGKNNWLLFKHQDEFADPEWEMKTILHYGSRKESPKSSEKKAVEKNALETLVKQAAKKKTAKRKLK
jgi:bifunctional non-homologous end joining protein LigD